jgi:hypothetical protein
MPDPRSVSFSGEIIMGFKDGRTVAFDEYGRRPWEPGYRRQSGANSSEWDTFHKFQGEFATLFGAYRRGRAFRMGQLDPEKDTDYLHNYHLSIGKRQRRGIRAHTSR